MLRVDTNIQGLDKLQEEIKKLQKLIELQSDTNFNKFLKNKVWDTLQQVMNERLTGGTTNDELIEEYKLRNKIEDTTNGFVLYNDFVIPQASAGSGEGYKNGFNIALAFEYGVGIMGEGTYDKGASTFTPWEYNINQYNFGWYFQKDGKTQHTYGYMGFEIYRYVADNVNKNLPQWIEDYKNGKEVGK